MKRLGLSVILMGCLLTAGCASFYTQQSSLPSAATLTAACAQGKAETPPVRDNACDIYNLVASACSAQNSLPLNAVQACTIGGYATAGGFVPL